MEWPVPSGRRSTAVRCDWTRSRVARVLQAERVHARRSLEKLSIEVLSRKNTPQDVEELTQPALVAPDRLRARVLTTLNGVGIRMASALLAVVEPTKHTVFDVRAIETLIAQEETDSKWPTLDSPQSYERYRALCLGVAAREHVDLRSLDRALWAWSKNTAPTSEPGRRRLRSTAGS
jgi:hypothetical protein